MSTLALETVQRELAPVGPENPLPTLGDRLSLQYEPDDAIPPAIAAGMRFGGVRSIHPYLRQDGYGRDRAARDLTVAVLENDLLRAEFAPGLGGRLLSLVDRRTGRELLWRNPVIQPANLALRNAWFAGGVEWNIGLRGHSPLTCSPVFAGRVRSGGHEVLRFWEFERLRGLLFQLDFALDPERPRLVWRTRVRNLGAETVPMYWWTNIAVPEAGTRVYAPADRAYRTGRDERLEVVDLQDDGYLRPDRAAWAADMFFDTGDRPPWIAAVDADGAGILHASTPRLRGRKLFAWGGTPGGRRWNAWLAGEGAAPYAEIQAGLTTTQYEHLPMPGRTDWSWTESLQPVQVGAEVAAADWHAAVARLATAVSGTARFDDPTAALVEAVADAEPEVLHAGGDWFALEREVARRAGDEWAAAPGTPVPRAPSRETAAWWEALSGQARPAPPVEEAPASYVAGARWRAILAGGSADWWTLYQRAVLAHAEGSPDAGELYRASLAAGESAWALRGLAHLTAGEGAASGEVVALARRTVAARPGDRSLLIDLVTLLRDHGLPEEAWSLLVAGPERQSGREELLEAELALRTGRVDRARELLRRGIVVPDLREGETALSGLWREAFPGEPVPVEYDFDMS